MHSSPDPGQEDMMGETSVPKNLAECIVQLESTLDDDSRKLVMDMESEKAMNLFHHGSGTNLRNSWGLWGDSPLAKWFNEQGIYHADDMSGIIFTSFWRHMHNRPIKLEEQVKFYQDYWEDKGIDIKKDCGK